MEALWNLEDKWRVSTRQALLFLLFAASGVIGLCVAASKPALLRRLRSRKSASSQQLIIAEEEQHGDDTDKNKRNGDDDEEWAPAACGWAAVRTALMGSVRWSRASKWRGEMGRGEGEGAGRETPLPLLEKRRTAAAAVTRRDEGGAWPSHSSDSPVWQRPILMGEKCKLPRFSGLILYDNNGQLLCDVSRTETSSCKQVVASTDQEKNTGTVVRTTLRDLL